MNKLALIALLSGALAEIDATGKSEGCTFGPDPEIQEKLEAALVILRAEPVVESVPYAKLLTEFKALRARMTQIEKSMNAIKPPKPAKPDKLAKIVDTTHPFYRATARWTDEENKKLAQLVTGSKTVLLSELCLAIHRSPGAILSRLQTPIGFPKAQQEKLANALTLFNEKHRDRNTGRPVMVEESLEWASTITVHQTWLLA